VTDEGSARFLRHVGSYKSHMASTSQKTLFFIVTAVKTSNLTYYGRIFLFVYLWDWSGTKSTITEAIYWPIVPALDPRIDDFVAISRMNEWQGN
jgi:hypothetical protein